jgi:heme-binding HmuY-like protein
MSLRLACGLIFAALLAAACGDDGASESPDAAPAADAPCEPSSALPLQWRPIDIVSTGTVTGSAAAAVVDATAGGLDGAADNPYIYLDLAAGARVDITDVDALESSAWQIAFKRSSIRINGGDSGPAGVTAAAVDAATLEEVTEAPASGFATDDWADDQCNFIGLDSGEPATAFGFWYDYDDQTHVVTPKAQVWIVRQADGTDYKLRIETYYGDEANPMRGGIYRMAWAPL